MNPKTKRLGLLLAPALAVALVPIATGSNSYPADAKSALPPGFENITPTVELRGPELAFGKLTGEVNGKVVRVFVYATPEIPANAQTGDKLPPEVPVAIGSTDGSLFSAVADPAVDLTELVNESGVVDFRAIALTSEHVGMWVFSRRLDTHGRVVEPHDTGPAMEATGDGKPVEVANPNAITIDVSHELQEAPAGADAAQAQNCTIYYSDRHKTLIATGFHRKKGAQQKVTYMKEASSTLGVGLNLNGEGWQLSGSVERVNSSRYGIAWYTKGGQDEFHYTKHQIKHTQCGWIWDGSRGYWRYDELRPHALIGGNFSYGPRWYPVTPKRYCVKHSPAGPGHDMEITDSQATTFRRGIRLGPIDLSSKSGFTEEVGIRTNFNRPIYVCGWTDYPGGDRPGLVAYGLAG